MDLPDGFVKLLCERYSPSISDEIISGCVNRPATFRVNTLKASIGEVTSYAASFGIELTPVSWSDTTFICGSDENVLKTLDIYREGKIYLQSLSSMIPPIVAEPKAGESILDMAAAPGGKTTEMAALSGGLADITACEKNKIRADRLRYNLEKQGAKRVTVIQTDARRLDDFFSFDKILLDAPCSGSGTITPDYCGFSVELFERSVRVQAELLTKALKLLKPGHRMVYSTCSVLFEENEGVLQKVLPKFGAKVIPIADSAFKGAKRLPVKIPGTLAICPDRLYEGFFVALIEKSK